MRGPGTEYIPGHPGNASTEPARPLSTPRCAAWPSVDKRIAPPGAAVDGHGGRRKRTMLISLCDIAPNADNRPGTAKFHHQWRGRDTAHPPATQTEWRCTREARQTQNDTGEVGRDTRGTKPVFPCRALPCPGSALPRCPIRAKVVVYGTVTCLRIPLLVHDPRTTYSLTVFSPLAPRLLAPLLAS